MRNQIFLSAKEATPLLLFLQSFVCEPNGAVKFAAAVESFGDDLLPKTLNQAFDVFSPSQTIDSVQDMLIGDDHSQRTKRSLARFKIFVEEWQRRQAANYYQTNIGKVVWNALDRCAEERVPTFIQGREGRGKSASGYAWYEAHRTGSRYVTCSGLGVQRDFFYTLADAYGVRYSKAKGTNGAIRHRIMEAIINSGLVLIIDEAHHLLPRVDLNTAPWFVNFINCDLCNAGVAVALVTTPQFGKRMAAYEARTDYNLGQFVRRFARGFHALPEKTTEADLLELATRFLPKVGRKGYDIALGYAGAFDRDVSGLFDLVRDAESRCRLDGRNQVSYQDLCAALTQDRLPADNAIFEAFTLPGKVPGFTNQPAENLPELSEATAATLQRNCAPDFTPDRTARAVAPVQMSTVEK